MQQVGRLPTVETTIYNSQQVTSDPDLVGISAQPVTRMTASPLVSEMSVQSSIAFQCSKLTASSA